MYGQDQSTRERCEPERHIWEVSAIQRVSANTNYWYSKSHGTGRRDYGGRGYKEKSQKTKLLILQRRQEGASGEMGGNQRREERIPRRRE